MCSLLFQNITCWDLDLIILGIGRDITRLVLVLNKYSVKMTVLGKIPCILRYISLMSMSYVVQRAAETELLTRYPYGGEMLKLTFFLDRFLKL